VIQRRHFIQACAGTGLGTAFSAHANTGLRWELRSGKAFQIAVGAGGHVWALGADPIQGGFPIFRRDGNTWTPVGGALTSLAIDAQGQPWGCNDSKVIFRMEGGKWKALPGRAEQVVIGGKGTVFALGGRKGDEVETSVFEWGGGSWTPIAGAKGVRLAVDENDYPWLLMPGGEIRRHDGGGWKDLPGRAMDLSVGARGGVWAVGHDARAGGFGIHRWDGQRWTRIDGGATAVAVAPNGLPWIVNDTGAIFQRV
jgi:hypothetical protein